MPNEIYLPGTIRNEINEAARKLKADGTIDIPTNTASFLATVVINVGTNEIVGLHPLSINGKLLDARIGMNERWYIHRGADVDIYSDPENGVKADIAQLASSDPLLANRMKLIVQGVYDPSTEPEPAPKDDEDSAGGPSDVQEPADGNDAQPVEA